MAGTNLGSQRVVWKRATVEGRGALYGVTGEGKPCLFLHGWALGQHSYRRALQRLVHHGHRVYIPALPGFGGTVDLPRRHFSLVGYAEWVDEFLRATKVVEPVLLIGHSFGGGVGIQFAHDFPERVSSLVLVNSIGGSAWASSGSTVRSMADRPLWDWGIHFPRDVLPLPNLTRVLPVVLEDALPNLVRNPRAIWRVAQLARRADLTYELEELKKRALPVVVVWGNQDRIIPRASFEALCAALGSEGEVVDGNHSWLLADPDTFGEVITNALSAISLARAMEEDDEKQGWRKGRLGAARARAARELRTLAHGRPGRESAGLEEDAKWRPDTGPGLD